ncbi:MAG: glycosyltransferase family 2 protein [Lachnospiraceae bacterium]|nr:glycosyltransferase family 2 protein [Lachnospiraceae bacterium]
MKISVLITAYNIKDYIAECLDSVLMQKTAFDYEIIVGDDGSDDGTWELLNIYAAKHPGKIRLVRQPRDKDREYNRVSRSAANRLAILKEAKGEYISFLDGDDYYISEDRLSRLAEALEDEADSDCICAASNLSLVWEDGHSMPLSRAKCERKISLEEYWPLMFLQANAMMFRNIYKEDTPKGPLAAVFDDNNMTCWLLRHGKMYYIPDTLGAYRQVTGSSWNAIDLLKQSASNMIGWSVERYLMPDKHRLSAIRHVKDLKYLYDRRGTFTAADLEPFYTTALENKLTFALRIYSALEEECEDSERIRKQLMAGGLEYAAARAGRAAMKLTGKY